jgi:hypothetical protein
VLDAVFAGDAHIGDICSSVGAQGWNINEQVPGVEPGSMSTPCTFPLVGMVVVGKRCRCLKYRVLPFGTLLGPETTGPYELTAVWLEVARFRVVSDCSCAGPKLPR